MDKLDMRLLEVETRKANNIRRSLLANCWGNCQNNNPDCPYVKANKPCKKLLQEIDTTALLLLVVSSEGN